MDQPGAAPHFGGPLALRILAGLTLVTLLLIAGRVIGITDRISLDPNEGWNAFQAVAAMGGGPLYPAPDALTANNYPPLSFYLVGALGWLVGDLIVAGRIVALVSVLAVAGLVWTAAWRLTGRHMAGWLGGLIVLLFAAGVFRAYLAMNDPQWLGLAFIAAALVIVLWPKDGQTLSPAAAVGAALLLGTGLLIKHNAVALPAAMGLYLLAFDRRSAAIWAGLAVLAVPAVLFADRTLFSGAMLAQMTGAARTYSFARMAGHGAIVLLFVPLLIAAWPQLSRWRADPRIALLALASGLSIALATVQGSGAGVDVNAWFEVLVCCAIVAATALAGPRAAAGEAGWRQRWTLPLAALPLLATAGFGTVTALNEGRERSQRLAATQAAIDAAAQVDGAVACEIQALCYWAGKSFALDYFLYGQRIEQTGLAPELDAALADRRIAAALIEGDGARVLPPAQHYVAKRMTVSRTWPERRLFQLR